MLLSIDDGEWLFQYREFSGIFLPRGGILRQFLVALRLIDITYLHFIVTLQRENSGQNLRRASCLNKRRNVVAFLRRCGDLVYIL